MFRWVTGEILPTGIREEPNNYYQRVDDGQTLVGLKLRGAKLLGCNIQNLELPANGAKFVNPKNGHVEITRQQVIYDDIALAVENLRKKD